MLSNYYSKHFSKSMAQSKHTFSKSLKHSNTQDFLHNKKQLSTGGLSKPFLHKVLLSLSFCILHLSRKRCPFPFLPKGCILQFLLLNTCIISFMHLSRATRLIYTLRLSTLQHENPQISVLPFFL